MRDEQRANVIQENRKRDRRQCENAREEDGSNLAILKPKENIPDTSIVCQDIANRA